MSQRLSHKRRKMSQNQSSNESSDESSDESESESDSDEEADDSPARAGVIERITLKNFMCHDSLEVNLGPQINFIIGRNGSGKSAILTGISVGLGAKATDTNRGNSIRDLIKDGKSTARVSIVFLNEGIGAFKPELFGKRIIIERRLQRAGANSYSIKSALGKTVSTKKTMLDEILYKFSITIDNPLAFLSQDKAREFLTSTTDRTKYDYFMAGAFINDILANYDGTVQNIVQVDGKVQQAKEFYQVCCQKYKEIAVVYNRHRQSDFLRQKLTNLHGKVYWYNVHHVERKVEQYEVNRQRLNQEINDLDNEKQKCENDLANSQLSRPELDNSVNQLSKEFEEKKKVFEETRSIRQSLREQLVDLNNEIVKGQEDIDKLKQQIVKNEEGIEIEHRRLDEINGGSKETLHENLEQLQDQRRELLLERDETRAKLENLKQGDSEQDRIRSEIDQAHESIAQLNRKKQDLERSSKDQYAPWSSKMKRAIDQINNYKGWKKLKPIGPLGSYIEVKDEYKEWKTLLNTVLIKTLDSFLVCDDGDRQVLLKILRSNNLRNNIIVRNPEKFDYLRGKATNQITFLDMLNINNDHVLYTIIDSNNIEKSIIAKDRNQSTTLCHQPNVMNVYTLFSKSSGSRTSQSGNTTRQDPVYYNQFLAKFANGTNNSEYELQEITTGINEAHSFINDSKREQRRLSQMRNTKIKQYEDELIKRNTLLQRLQVEIGNIENKLREDGDISKVESLTVQIEEFKSQILRTEGVLASLDEEMESKRNEFDELNDTLKLVKDQVLEVKDQKEAAEKKLLDLDTEVAVFKDSLQQYDIERNRREIEVKRCEAKIEEGTGKLNELIRIAEEKCRRDEVTITEEDTQESIASEYSEVQHQIREAEKQIGKSLEEVQRELLEAKEKRNNANQILEDLDRTCRKLDKDLNIRFNFLHTTILSSVQQASRTFENALGLRGFRGTLEFAFDKKTLTLLAQTKNDKERRTVDSLSGGEKSFAQIALLLSIWKIMDSKIRGLDEFDVYMDSVNRSISIKLLLRELRKYPKSQNIFITPQDIAVVGDIDSSDVKIHRMSDPRSD
ncbi:uncharacterized protein RJT21DRAFT_122891 [Scheffersomyces amazonensis]|uniref:uncharacterized protein n=1 Tax=Scheffersomyces amazonensis TaxID=1078765 RepID=UPI00315D81D9